MTVVVPGALWLPVDVGNRAARRKGRGFIAHVAVSESPRLVPGPLSTRPADWTFYFPKDPTPTGQRFIQQIDFDLQCWSSVAGNATCPAGESQGGVNNPNGEPWTDNQAESIAIVYAFGMEHEGWPDQLMPDSRPGSRGLGWHRLGIDPWRVSGGELWSSSRGKVCPGDAKIAGMPMILARARELFHGSPSPAPAPAPAPAPRTAPPRLRWILPRGHYVGDIKGPARSHGGDPRYDSAAVIALVRNVQQWLTYHGCVPGVTNWRSGWADGRFERPYSTDAMTRWHQRFYRNQPFPDQCWSDDYDRLSRP